MSRHLRASTSPSPASTPTPTPTCPDLAGSASTTTRWPTRTRRSIARGHRRSGPHAGVLNALYRAVHEQALHEWWLSGQSDDRAAALTNAVWQATYPIAFHDALGRRRSPRLRRPPPADRPDRAAWFLHRRRAGRADPHRHHHRRHRPAGTEAARTVLADATVTVDADPGHGWRNAVGGSTTRATAAADGRLRSDRTAGARQSHGQADALTQQAFGGWVDRALRRRPAGPGRPASRSAANDRCVQSRQPARAYPAVASVRVASTVDAAFAVAARPLPAAGLASGRAR